jgi:hypothetical protein
METDNIVLEHLRAIRTDLAELKAGQRDIVQHIISPRLRETARDGDLATHTQPIARLQVDVDRIKRRLELVDD